MNRKYSPSKLALWGALLVGAASSSVGCWGKTATDCADGIGCATGTGGDAGSSGNGGSNSGGSSSGVGGKAGAGGGGNAGSSATGGGAGNAGSAGAAPCDGACGGATSVCLADTNKCVECTDKSTCKSPKAACDTATNACVECADKSTCKAPKPACDAASNACVECTASTDCTDNAKPFCDTTVDQCVACLKQADCTSPTASACAAGACVACTKDAECSNIAGKGVCNTGTCVQCTAAKESACGGKSCNPATSQCTTTAVGTADYCQPCLADSECIGGNKADPDARCTMMKFMGAARPGGFCLRRASKTCTKPYNVAVSAMSLSGAPAENYCGIDQDSTRCEAVLDFVASRACADGLDTSCGCTRNKAGACIDSGQGGLCKTVGLSPNTCTIPCGNAVQCTSITTCASAIPYCH